LFLPEKRDRIGQSVANVENGAAPQLGSL